MENREIYSAITRNLIYLPEEELKNMNIKLVHDIIFTSPTAFTDNVSFYSGNLSLGK